MTLYLTLKALHIIAVIAWMAGMLYLPRLFVYHVNASGETAETFKIMERRLFKFIMNPALISTWVFGGLLLWQMPGFLHEGWFHGKALLVLLMTGMHGWYGRFLKDFRDGKNTKSARFYKMINEIPTLFMVGIVFLVIFKGF